MADTAQRPECLATDTMSHTVVNSSMKKTDYKDYVSFLGTYKSGKKEDQGSLCSSDSGISIQSPSMVSRDSSSTSLNSDTSDASKCTSYNSYLESYNNKKFSSVKMPPQNGNTKSNDQCNNQAAEPRQKVEPPKTVKSEIFVQIVNPEKNVGQITKTFEIPGQFQKPTLHRQNSLSSGIKNIVDTFESKQKTEETPLFKSISRSNSVNKNITNKQKPFTSATLPRKASVKSPVIQKVNVGVFEAKKDSDEVDTTFLLKRNNSLNSSRSKKHFASIHKLLTDTVVPQQADQGFNGTNGNTEVKAEAIKASSVSKPPLSPPCMPPKCPAKKEIAGDLKVIKPNGTPPLPPPLPPNSPTSRASINTNNNSAREVKVSLSIQCTVNCTATSRDQKPSSPSTDIVKNSSPTVNCAPPLPPSSSPSTKIANNSSATVNCAPPPPPPPPLPTMSMNSSAAVRRTSSPPTPKWKDNGSERPAPFSSSTLPRQGASGQVNQKVSVRTNEPLSEAVKAELIKKQAYTMLRGMYGSYHDQANGYISKLPSYMVKKDNGLKNIISNIEAQGGLEKLNGRVNPKVEAE